MAETKKLSEIAEIINGYAFESKKYVDDGLRIIRIANVQDGVIVDNSPCFYPANTDINIKKFELFENDILLSLTGNVGRIGILPACMLPAVLNQRVCCLRPNESVNYKYLYYFLRRRCFAKDCVKASKGVAQLNLSTKWLADYSIYVPDLSEQNRIVSQIEELFSQLDASVNELKKAKERLKVYRQAVYASIYEGLSDMYPITDFFDITGGLTKNSKRNDFPIKMPYLRVANVYYNSLDLNEIKEIGVLEREIEPCLLKKNDLLFVEGNGSKSQIGRVAIWDGSISNCLHQNHLIKGRPLGSMLSEYALYYLISRGGRKQIVDVAKSTSGLYTLSTNKVKDLKVPYCDLTHQRQLLDTIDERISSCDSIEKNVDTALQQAEALRQSILKKTFEGG